MSAIRLFFAGLTCCIAFQAKAQDSIALEQARVAMIRQAIVFYSYDTSLAHQPVSCDAQDISGLKSCARNLAGVNDRIDTWMYPLTNADDLKLLGEKIKAAVLKARKDYRQKLPQYKDFTDAIDKIAADAANTNITTIQGGLLVATNVDTGRQTAVREDSNAAANAAVKKDQPSHDIFSGLNIWNGLAILLAAGALIKSFLPRKRRRSGSNPGGNNFGMMEQPGAGNIETDRKLQSIELELRKVNEMITEVDIRTTAKFRQLQQEAIVEPPQWEAPSSLSNAAVKTPQPRRKWAKNADSGGFDADSLSDEPDNKKIYELIIDGPASATYSISDNREAQLFALENPNNMLRGACEYNTAPEANSRITTLAPGKLRLQGNKWKITTPAKINFS